MTIRTRIWLSYLLMFLSLSVAVFSSFILYQNLGAARYVWVSVNFLVIVSNAALIWFQVVLQKHLRTIEKLRREQCPTSSF